MRLIDIDTTYPLLKERLTWLGQYGDDVYRLACECIRGVMETQPTAHDVDKVLKQLDEKSFFVATSKEFYDNPQDGKNVSDVIEISDAIEIVKGGGTDAADGLVEESVVYQDFMKRSRN